jgi:hypothetical protein
MNRAQRKEANAMQIAIPSASTNEAAVQKTQTTASLLSQSVLYSASAGGKTYPADIALSGGEYVATVPQLPGLTANGNTLLSAETSLQARISVFV